jgi:guanylate kinase
VIIIHTVYCVLGRTSSGKSTITQKAANNLNMKVLKSYTTRQRRENETDENCDHIFISSNEVEKYRNDMIAYTDRVGYCSFATKQQLLDNDFYIINPTGYYELKLKTKDMDIELVTIMVNVPYNDLRQRARKRGDYDAWQANYIKESEEFSNFEKSHLVDYFILNDRSLEESVAKMVRVINKDRAKRGITDEK